MLAKILSQRHGFKAHGALLGRSRRHDQSRRTASRSPNPAALDTADAHRHVAALPRLAGRGHGALRQAAAQAGKPIVALRTSTHAFNGLAKGEPVGDVELQQPGRLREARARRDVADPLGPAQGRGHARRDRAGAARESAAARHHRHLRRHGRVRGLSAGRRDHPRPRRGAADAGARSPPGELPEDARDRQAAAGRQRPGRCRSSGRACTRTTTARPTGS